MPKAKVIYYFTYISHAESCGVTCRKRILIYIGEDLFTCYRELDFNFKLISNRNKNQRFTEAHYFGNLPVNVCVSSEVFFFFFALVIKGIVKRPIKFKFILFPFIT